MTALIVKEDGLIYVNEVPEKPKFIDTMEAVENCWNDKAMSDYNKALASAKENAVLCADQEVAAGTIYLYHKDCATFTSESITGVKPGIYPIPDLKWEVKELFYCRKCGTENCTACEGERTIYRRKKAILTLSEQPKPHGFCVTPNSNCSMNYCDDNGCQDRRRELVEPKGEPMKNLSKEEVRTAMTDIDLVRDWAKCGIYHNHGYNEARAEEYIAILDSVISQFKSKSEAVGWISVKERPLITKDEKGRWTCTKDGDQEFIAAIQYHEIDKGDFWWIRHCVIEDQTGLCVVGDDDNEPAGWSIEDVEFWQPLPSPPEVSVGEEKKDLTLNQKDNHDQRPEG